MNASEAGSKDWWTVVQSMPLEEAELCLRDYKTMLLLTNQGTEGHVAAGYEIHKINVEIARIIRIQDKTKLSKAMRNVITPEQCEEVFAEQARLQQMEGIV